MYSSLSMLLRIALEFEFSVKYIYIYIVFILYIETVTPKFDSLYPKTLMGSFSNLNCIISWSCFVANCGSLLVLTKHAIVNWIKRVNVQLVNS